MLKKLPIFLFIAVILMFDLSAKSVSDLFIAEETAIDYFPASNYVCINEYNLLYTGKNSTIKKDIKSIKELIKSAKYSEEKFGINDFYAVEESLSNEGKYARGKYDLILKEDIKRGFDLTADTLLRVTQIKYSQNVEKLIFSNHHIRIRGFFPCWSPRLQNLCYKENAS